LVDATYVGTLDCPGLNGIRDIEDVLIGYRAVGVFDPGLWLFVRHEGKDVGCLILTAHPGHGTWELTYMGLIPQARGHGWGTDIARYAEWLAGKAGQSRVVLAMDAMNGPAIRMYAAAGFQAWDRKSVYLRIYPY
jgi:ribosomal protein S18 acetylase RimI-like enzyme